MLAFNGRNNANPNQTFHIHHAKHNKTFPFMIMLSHINIQFGSRFLVYELTGDHIAENAFQFLLNVSRTNDRSIERGDGPDYPLLHLMRLGNRYHFLGVNVISRLKVEKQNGEFN
jgi:hypothetical protein